MQPETQPIVLTRPESGRPTRPAHEARRNEVLRLVSLGTPRAKIVAYVVELGYSENTAKGDIEWARVEWKAQENNDETVADIIRRHRDLYYDLAHQARQQRDIRLEADMLGRVEKLMGLHRAQLAVQFNNTSVAVTTHNYDLTKLDADRLDQLRHLLEAAKNDADAA